MHPSVTERRHLLQVTRGETPADTVLEGGTLIDVLTGEVRQADLALARGRVAGVGHLPGGAYGPETKVVNLAGRYLAPAFVEPHAHPFMLYNPITFAGAALAHGTVTAVADALIFQQELGAGAAALVHALQDLPFRYLWAARAAAQTQLLDDDWASGMTLALLKDPAFVQLAEVTSWPAVLRGDDAQLGAMLHARALGKRVDGHLAGASARTVQAMTAAGLTACHEAITPEEILDRLRAGLTTMLRHSSLRPDLPALLPALTQVDAGQRVLLTTDGPTPAYLWRHGLTDHLVAICLDAGLPLIQAYRMATINPAMYLGLDAEFGCLAPGRAADFLVLDDPRRPNPPQEVWVRGQRVARQGLLEVTLPEPDWAELGLTPLAPLPGLSAPMLLPPEDLELAAFDLESAAITRRLNLLPERDALARPRRPDLCWLALLDRDGHWVVPTALRGFAEDLGGIACTFTGAPGVLVVGRAPEDMAEAARQALNQGGGIVWVEQGEVVFRLPLPLGGYMSTSPLEILGPSAEAFSARLKQAGYRHHDPFYTLLFLSCDLLPDLRLTPQGIWDVKAARVIAAPIPLAGAAR